MKLRGRRKRVWARVITVRFPTPPLAVDMIMSRKTRVVLRSLQRKVELKMGSILIEFSRYLYARLRAKVYPARLNLRARTFTKSYRGRLLGIISFTRRRKINKTKTKRRPI